MFEGRSPERSGRPRSRKAGGHQQWCSQMDGHRPGGLQNPAYRMARPYISDLTRGFVWADWVLCRCRAVVKAAVSI